MMGQSELNKQCNTKILRKKIHTGTLLPTIYNKSIMSSLSNF